MRFLCAFDYKCQSVDFTLLLQAAEEIEVEVTLTRVDGGSLGFNIMGGTEVKRTFVVILDKRNSLIYHLFENSVRVAQTNPVLYSARYAIPSYISRCFLILFHLPLCFLCKSVASTWRVTLLAQACGVRCVKRLAPN